MSGLLTGAAAAILYAFDINIKDLFRALGDSISWPFRKLFRKMKNKHYEKHPEKFIEDKVDARHEYELEEINKDIKSNKSWIKHFKWHAENSQKRMLKSSKQISKICNKECKLNIKLLKASDSEKAANIKARLGQLEKNKNEYFDLMNRDKSIFEHTDLKNIKSAERKFNDSIKQKEEVEQKIANEKEVVTAKLKEKTNEGKNLSINDLENLFH